MNLQKIFNENRLKVTEKFKKLPLGGKIGVGIGAFIIGTNLLSSLYSKIYNGVSYDSMHSGTPNSMSAYSNMMMTDFGSSWKGLSKNILGLLNKKNYGLSEMMKTSMTAFNYTGVDLGRTMIKVRKPAMKHRIVNMKSKISNIVLETQKIKNIGHIIH
jgi:hypothetical protein